MLCETMHLSAHRFNLNINLNTYLSPLAHGKQFSLQLGRVFGTIGDRLHINVECLLIVQQQRVQTLYGLVFI